VLGGEVQTALPIIVGYLGSFCFILSVLMVLYFLLNDRALGVFFPQKNHKTRIYGARAPVSNFSRALSWCANILQRVRKEGSYQTSGQIEKRFWH